MTSSYKAFKVEELQDGQIIKVLINRPKSMNAMNPDFFEQIYQIFTSINQKQNARVVILMGQGKVFTAGLDLKQYGSMFNFDFQSQEPARLGIKMFQIIRKMQKQCLAVFNCRVPVLAGVHNLCIGGGIDLLSMVDIRYATHDCKFTIKEIDIGMAADLGTLQLMPNIIGNQSAFRQLAYTGRFFDGKQAKEIGFISKTFDNLEQLQKGLIQTAKLIISKSPVGIYTLKHVNNHQLQRKIGDGLQYIARVNTSALLTKDMMSAITAWLNKQKPIFPKL